MKQLLVRFLALCVVGSPFAAHASAEFIIGQTAGFTGSSAASVKAMTTGARLIIESVNQAGGVQGKRIKLVSVDDGLIPKRAVENAEQLIKRDKAIALFLNRGTPHTLQMLSLLEQHGVPLIGPSTGAMELHSPVRPMVFNVRPTYQAEAMSAVLQFKAMYVDRIGVIYSSDPFGEDALVGIRKGFAEMKMEPDFVVPYDFATGNADKGIELALKQKDGKYPALLIVGTNAVTSKIIKAVREKGNANFIATLSTNASAGFVKELGDYSKFILVSQAFPSERAMHIPIVSKVATLLKEQKVEEALSPSMLEGAVAAEVLIEGLRRCATPCTSANLVKSLESGRPISVGWPGHDIVYTRNDHSGIKYSDTSIIVDGKFRR